MERSLETTSYVRVCELAQGGMGTVDLALRHEGKFRRLYAVKRLHTHLRADPDVRSMFLDEARIAGLLNHPNAVSVLDVGQDEDGPFLIMDFVEGIDLGKLIALTIERQEPVPVQICVRIALAVARGLHAAHELTDHDGSALELVHRDLSPQNVLVSYDGNVRIADFGIAKALGRSTRTSTGVLKGKMAYMSPEQLRFEEPDRRSDLFSLGVVLYELLAGARLYRSGSGADAARRILNEPPPDIGEIRPEVPPEIVALLFSLLAKDRDDRPATAADVAQRLEAALAALLRDEDSMDVGEYVSDIAADHRAERKQTLADAIAAAERGEPTIVGALAPMSIEKPAPPRRRSRALAISVLVAVLVGGAIGVAAFELTGSTDTAPDAVVTPDEPGPEEPPLSEEPLSEEPLPEEPGPAADVARTDRPTTPEQPAEPTAEEPTRPGRDRPNRMTRPAMDRGPMDPPTMMGLERWDW